MCSNHFCIFECMWLQTEELCSRSKVTWFNQLVLVVVKVRLCLCLCGVG